MAVRLGPIAIPGHRVVRSAIRWLCGDGEVVHAGEPIAYCNIGIIAEAGGTPFADEARDFQIAFAPLVSGRVNRAAATKGGFLDRLNSFHWAEDFVLAHITPDGAALPAGDPGLPRLLLLAGRRMTELAEDRSGLLTGWHDRARGWWGEGAPATLLGLGTCEQIGVLRGDRGAFLELFAATPGAMQVVTVQDEPLVPSVRILIEQLARTPDDMRVIEADAAAGFAAISPAPEAGDWLFLGALLAGLRRTPITDDYPVFDRAGLHRAPPAAAIALSITSELPPALRHRRLGYTIACHPFRLAQAGQATRAWLAASFAPAARDTADIAADYRLLARLAGEATGAALLVLNGISTQAYEDILHYSAFDRPLGATLSSVRAKERNVMLDGLAGETGLTVIDVDAIVAEQGMWAHLPDGVHQSGAVQAAIRAEIMRVLRDRGLPG